ncbi:MAG TPA: hypothetical protein DCM86_07920 [Verrucomicrobiales bacterium]|nr:hypothetical protein [Verrucomicrobiales bacterium]
MHPASRLAPLLWLLLLGGSGLRAAPAALRLEWVKNILTIHGAPAGEKGVSILYLEAFCRPNSTTNEWARTVIPHTTELVSATPDQTRIELRSHLADGVEVEHVIRARGDEVDFRLIARNPTSHRSEAHWAQPCIRVGEFTGLYQPGNPQTYDYLRKSFLFLEGRLERMPTRDWATSARYVPGQVWAAPGVPRSDVNPRPLSPLTPSNGLIGCFSDDDRRILATAWEPYQELFQGVITCLHSDFRIGGLAPGEARRIHGKLYLVRNDVPALLRRYAHDFPAQSHVGR